MPYIFISEDDLISILWFITREQFYAISQVNGQFDYLSDKFLERYPQKDVDLLRIKAAVANGNGQENQQQLIDNRLFIQRRNKYGVLMDEKEIPFANVHNYPKIGTIQSIRVLAPLQENALKFLQSCKEKFNPRKEVHFTSFDAIVQSLTPDQLAIFSSVFYDFRFMYLRNVPTQLDAFGQFLNISGCRNIWITSIRECDVDPFVEWLTQNPLEQIYRPIHGRKKPILDYPSIEFKRFPMNVPKLVGTKCRQAFNSARKSKNAPAMPGMCPYYDLFFVADYSNYGLRSKCLRMKNANNGDKFLYKICANNDAWIECKPKERIPPTGFRSTGKETKILIDFE